MPYFPGIAMVIDDKFSLAYDSDSELPEVIVQQKPLKNLKTFFEDNCIPYVPITNTSAEHVINKIKNHDNVRLLVLDLDLNDDGDVGEEDDVVLVLNVLTEALKKYGYFFLFINSAHSDKWEELIKPQLLDKLAVFSNPNNPIRVYDKAKEDLSSVIIELQAQNFSLELIYEFESTLNKARDKAFNGLIDFEKRTWNRIYKQLLKEAGTQSSFLLSTAYLSIIKQFFLAANYTTPELDDPINPDLAIKAFNQINYILNIDNALAKQPIWTGNLYHINAPTTEGLNYALIVTPECDLAQSKFINYQIVFGYEINNESFPDEYNHAEYNEKKPPLHAYKLGKKKDKWRDKGNLKDVAGFIEHLYTMPFASKNNKTIILDFRDLTFSPGSEVSKWELVKRINDPMLTDILDKLSMIFNRKGLLPLLPGTIKPI